MFSVVEETISEQLLEKERQLVKRIKGLESIIVAYSGGVDSSLIAYYAKNLLGDKAQIVIAVSPSLAGDDLEAARAQASLFDWDLNEISTDEFENEEYQRNDDMRCFHCKTTLFAELTQIAAARGIKSIIYGANIDDQSDFRPGRIAAAQHDVIAPMEEAQLNKTEIRTLAKRAGLPSWDRPANACLSSRIPRNLPVTIDSLTQVEASEGFIRKLGFKIVRVRYHNKKAVVELGSDELYRLRVEPYLVNKIETALIDMGFDEVSIDPRGYRQGGANHDQQGAPAVAQTV